MIINIKNNDMRINGEEKNVLHLVADDPFLTFKDNEEEQFELILSLIENYHVNESITTNDENGNQVCLFYLNFL